MSKRYKNLLGERKKNLAIVEKVEIKKTTQATYLEMKK